MGVIDEKSNDVNQALAILNLQKKSLQHLGIERKQLTKLTNDGRKYAYPLLDVMEAAVTVLMIVHGDDELNLAVFTD